MRDTAIRLARGATPLAAQAAIIQLIARKQVLMQRAGRRYLSER